MKKFIFNIFLVLIIATLFVGCSGEKNSKKDTLVVGMELAYPPFETKDQNGEATGISVDFIKEFGKYIGRDVKIENIAWDGLIPSLQTKKVDLVISSMTITDERKGIVDFSNPYANSLLGMLVNRDGKVKTVEDLNKSGAVIAVKTGSTGFLYAQKYLKDAQIRSFPDESACVTEVVQGKADVFLYDQLTIYRNWQNNKEVTEAIFIPFQEAEKWGVAFPKGNEELVIKMNEFIEKFYSDGGFERLSEKYLPEERKAFKELGFQWFFDLKNGENNA